MDHFDYRPHVGGMAYFAEDCLLADIAHAVGTPCYIYSDATLRHHYQVFDQAFKQAGMAARIYFAVKTNHNLSVLRTLASEGAGMDIVSGGEFRRAEAAEVAGKDIVFSGVGKSLDEIDYALTHDVFQINIESIPELELIAARANAMNRKVEVALRVNPNVDAKTHRHISTGRKDNKFGIAIEDAPAIYQSLAKTPNLKPAALAMHIGSQITELEPFERALQRLAELAQSLKKDGIGLKRLDIGGGLGIPYNQEQPPLPADYVQVVAKILKPLSLPIMVEPGRLIAGNAGILLTRVLYEKNTAEKRFIIIDAAMNDLIRPALYGAYHQLIPCWKPQENQAQTPADIVGPVCESTDCFAKDVAMPPVCSGDLLAFRSAGAYSAVMASSYNSRLLVPEVMVKGQEWAVVRPRPTYEAMLAQEQFADWLEIENRKSA